MEASEEEQMDYQAPVIFPDSDAEDEGKLQEVSEETRKILEKACLKQMTNPTRLQTRAPYPLPKVTVHPWTAT